MKRLSEIIKNSNVYFENTLIEVCESGGLKLEQYLRYLQMQYHLTKGVQKPFMFIAGHHRTRPYSKLRLFLIRFAHEEEMHYKLAEKDMRQLNQVPGECPLDVAIWWSYYDSIIEQTPFVRLGATCILENIGNGAGEIIKKLVKSAEYLNQRNTTFLRVHLHEELPHGEQIMDAIEQAQLNETDYNEIVKGAHIGFLLYSRLLNWVLNGETVITEREIA